MVVPDFTNICEIELAAEGFLQARILAVKFVTLFQLCMELLSKQDHYDWGLRAMKGILRIAGGSKRANPVSASGNSGSKISALSPNTPTPPRLLPFRRRARCRQKRSWRS
jgi:hypothetical protein